MQNSSYLPIDTFHTLPAMLWNTHLEATLLHLSFPGGSDGKASACNVGDLGSIPG